jgi:hypothetical protein
VPKERGNLLFFSPLHEEKDYCRKKWSDLHEDGCCWRKTTLAWLLYADLTRRSCRAEESIIAWLLYERPLALAPLEELEAPNNHPCSKDLAYAGVSPKSFSTSSCTAPSRFRRQDGPLQRQGSL